MRKVLIILATVVLLAVGYVSFGKQTQQPANTPTVIPSPTSNPSQTSQEPISYQGEAGKDALTLLKAKATVEQDSSGLVVSINGRKADSGKREYWAFYVNGKLAEVGPTQYQTKSEDKVEWKIEDY